MDRLHECLNEQETRGEATEALRSIIDEIRLVPQEGALAIDLYGELGAILALTNDKAASGARSGHSTVLVAGAPQPPRIDSAGLMSPASRARNTCTCSCWQEQSREHASRASGSLL